MTITDPVQVWFETTCTIIDADAELRALFGRTTDLCLPWDDFTVDGPLPVIALQVIESTPLGNTDRRVTLQCSAYAAKQSDANKTIAYLDFSLLKYPAYNARGLQVGRDPSTRAVRRWPGADPRQDDAAVCRADVDLTFLIPG